MEATAPHSYLAGFDFFPKVDSSLKTQTRTGGVFGLFMLLSLVALTISELVFALSATETHNFIIDSGRSHKLLLNIDIRIASSCSAIQGDVLDITGANDPNLSKQLTAQQIIYDDKVGCRFKGSLQVNKVKGMLHFTLPGLAYASFFNVMPFLGSVNLTHSIDTLSFAEIYPGQIQVLEGTKEIASSRLQTFQYFLSLVPTTYVDRIGWFGAGRLFHQEIFAMQYAVTEFSRSFGDKTDGVSGANVPGIFFQYQFEPVSVKITSSRPGVLAFITRLCGLLGGNLLSDLGVYVVIGMWLRIVQWISSFR